MFGRKTREYDQCCGCPAEKATSDSIGAWELAKAIREVANTPVEVPGQKLLLIAQEGSIIGALPPNVTPIYVKADATAPIVVPMGY